MDSTTESLRGREVYSPKKKDLHLLQRFKNLENKLMILKKLKSLSYSTLFNK